MPLIELKDASARYAGEAVLKNINLTVEAGEKIALVGESGAGKSTLLQLIYQRCGQAASLTPQELGLVPALSVFHNVYMGRLHLHSAWRNAVTLLLPARGDVREVRALLARLRLDDKIFALVGELSGGQQQRTAVARALYHPGEILVADEPVSAVDEHHAREILDLVVGEKETVILALHDRSLALRYAGRVIGLKDGEIVLDAPTAGLSPADLDSLYRTAAR